MSWRRGLHAGQYEDPALKDVPFWPSSAGEVHQYYWFTRGGVMNSETRLALRRSRGFCERHAWGAFAAEMVFNGEYLLGSAVLYEDLIGRCLAAFMDRGPWRAARLTRQLRPKGPCLMCHVRAYRAGTSSAGARLVEQGRSTDRLLSYAREHQWLWECHVCSACSGASSDALCRRHLTQNMGTIPVDSLKHHRDVLQSIHGGVAAFGRSFVWENRGTATPRDRADLLSAIGWISGWRPLLMLLAI